MLGDTAVAVHPDDEGRNHFVGRLVHLPLTDRDIPIIADSYVDPEFGTGYVKITPAHDPNDYEIGLRHNLPSIDILTDDARMTDECGPYAGMTTQEARHAVVNDLEEQGYLVKIEPMRHNIGTCQRCDTIVEPKISLQWFVKMEPLAGPAIEAVRKGDTELYRPFQKIFSTGWRGSATGASRVSSGGGTAFPYGIAKIAMRSSSPRRLPISARLAAVYV